MTIDWLRILLLTTLLERIGGKRFDVGHYNILFNVLIGYGKFQTQCIYTPEIVHPIQRLDIYYNNVTYGTTSWLASVFEFMSYSEIIG